MSTNESPLLEPSPIAGDRGELIGKDPRRVPRADLAATGAPEKPMKAIRAFCLACCCGDASEVRKCTATSCALWSFRMAVNPFHGRAKARD